jgi:hypothetical protein
MEAKLLGFVSIGFKSRSIRPRGPQQLTQAGDSRDIDMTASRASRDKAQICLLGVFRNFITDSRFINSMMNDHCLPSSSPC